MATDRINELAVAFAGNFNIIDGWAEGELKAMAEPVLKWLLKDHLVVEKEKVRRLYHAKDRIYDTHSYDEYRRCECMGYMQAIEDIFPYLTIAEP